MSENFHMWQELSEVPELIKYNLDHAEDNIKIDFKKLDLAKINNIKLIASGSSNNASQAGRFIFEEILGIPTTIEYASEFAHKNYVLDKNTLVMPVSQSGKTADTMAAIKKIKRDIGAHILCMTNVKDSPINKVSNSSVFIGAGVEEAVPATKTFSLQLLALFNLALYLAKFKGINPDKLDFIREELYLVPELLKEVFEKKDVLKEAAEQIVKNEHIVFLSRGINHTIAREGALKFKETCYVDSNGYPAGEFMHGYMAMLDENVSVVTMEFFKDTFLRANLRKLTQKSNATFFALTMNSEKAELYNNIIEVPVTKTKLTSTFIFTSCLQIMSFYAARSLGHNPDNPRSLSKFLSGE